MINNCLKSDSHHLPLAYCPIIHINTTTTTTAVTTIPNKGLRVCTMRHHGSKIVTLLPSVQTSIRPPPSFYGGGTEAKKVMGYFWLLYTLCVPAMEKSIIFKIRTKKKTWQIAPIFPFFLNHRLYTGGML